MVNKRQILNYSILGKKKNNTAKFNISRRSEKDFSECGWVCRISCCIANNIRNSARPHDPRRGAIVFSNKI